MTIIHTAPDPWLAADGRIDLSAPGAVRPFSAPAPPEVAVIIAGAGSAERHNTPVGAVGFGPVARRLQHEPDGEFLSRYADRAAEALGVERVALIARDLGVHGVRTGSDLVHATYATMMWGAYGFRDEPWPGCYASLAPIAHRTELGIWFGSVDRVNHGTLAAPEIRWLSAPGSIACLSRAVADLASLGIALFGLDNLSSAAATLDQPPGAHWASGVEIPATEPSHAPGTSMRTPARSPGIVQALIEALDAAVPDAALIAESLLPPGRPIYTRCAGMRMLSSSASPLPDRPTVTRRDDIRELFDDAWTRQLLNPGVPICHLIAGDGWTADEINHATSLIRALPGVPHITIDWWSLAQATGVRPIE